MKQGSDNGKNTLTNLGWKDVLAFVLEMGALILWGMWAWSLPRLLIWKLVLAVLAVGGFIALWALFFARNAKNRASGTWLFIGKLLLLLPPGLMYFSPNLLLAGAWGLMVMLHLVVSSTQNH